jgi:hypothetical protein
MKWAPRSLIGMRISAHRAGHIALRFLKVPYGLRAREFKSYLWEHGEEICLAGL